MMESNKFEAPEAFDPLCVSAEGILSATLGNQIYINKIERLTEKGRRNLLLRCRVNPVDGLPSSFILKKVETETYDPDEANSGDMRRFFNDWVGSQFLNTLPSKSKHSPHFYGADRHLGFIILEDVKRCWATILQKQSGHYLNMQHVWVNFMPIPWVKQRLSRGFIRRSHQVQNR
jgi:hypothetical protein